MTIVRKKKQGKTDLEGNQSRAFLKCLDRLEESVSHESCSVIVNALPYIEALRAFNKVVHNCFGANLYSNHKDSIIKFCKLYRNLGISVTPKVSKGKKLLYLNTFLPLPTHSFINYNRVHLLNTPPPSV